jgi:hypothetical protein
VKLEEELKELISDTKIEDDEKYEPPQNMHRVVWALLKSG